jgi:hypothetical protein
MFFTIVSKSFKTSHMGVYFMTAFHIIFIISGCLGP